MYEAYLNELNTRLMATFTAFNITKKQGSVDAFNQDMQNAYRKKLIYGLPKGKVAKDLILNKEQVANTLVNSKMFHGNRRKDLDVLDTTFFSEVPIDTMLKRVFKNKDLFVSDGELASLHNTESLELNHAARFINMIDVFLKVVSMEYGVTAFTYLDDKELANSSQWWAWAYIHNFSTSALKHSGDMLKVTKNSNLSHTLNGASALFPTNVTYGALIDTLVQSSTVISSSDVAFKKLLSSNFLELLLLPKYKIAAVRVQNMLSLHLLQILLLDSVGISRFSNFTTGYNNTWRYRNYSVVNSISHVRD